MERKTSMDKIKSLAESICKFAPGGSSYSEHDGWSKKTARKPMKWISERKRIEQLAKDDDANVHPFGRGLGFGVTMLDTSTDTEYTVAFDPPAYKGHATMLYAYIIYNASIAYEEV